MMHILKYTIAATVLFASSSANSTLIGDDILIRFDGCCGGPTEDIVTVGAGFEISDGDGSNFEATTAGTAVTSIDVDASSVTFMMNLSYNLDNQFFTFSDLDWVGGDGFITDAVLSISEISTIVQSDISFGADWFSIEVGLQTPANYSPNRMVRIDLVTAHDVPEPVSLVLFGLGLAGLGLSKRKKA
jgi:hypothetical protein